MPRVLIADDDPVSLRFLAAALTQLGCDVVVVADGTDALAAAKAQLFDLLLLDRRMPRIGGAELLAALHVRGISVPAIATSAEVDTAIASQLRAAGFVDIVEKPATLARLEQALRPYLHLSIIPQTAFDASPEMRVLDDAVALRAIGGNADALRALRGLLAQELVALLEELKNVSPTTDCAAWHERLHRLRASCGFCGAVALADAAARLDRGLCDDPANAQPVLCDFLHICSTTLAALSDQVPSAMDGARTSPSIPQARKPTPSR